MKTTIYAKTLNPELFDYRVYDISNDDYNEVYIVGDRNYPDIDNKHYLQAILKLIDDYCAWDYEEYYNSSIKDFLNDYLPKKENGKKLSPAEMTFIKKALENNDDDETICACLTIITDKVYDWRYLRGCCQGEVVRAFYPNTVSNAYLDFVEAWFFGTGTEIEIHDSDNTPKEADDIEGFTFYTATYGIENLKKEIKRECGYKDDDEVNVELWLYDSSYNIRHDVYKKAD